MSRYVENYVHKRCKRRECEGKKTCAQSIWTGLEELRCIRNCCPESYSPLGLLQEAVPLLALCHATVAYPGVFFGGGSTNSVEVRGQRGRGSGGGSPLVRGSGGSCNLIQEISFHIVKFS